MAETEVKAPPSILVRLAKAYKDIDMRVAEIEEQLKKTKASRAAAEKKLVDEMITQQVKSFKTDSLGGFRTQACVYPNVIDREILNAYVKKKKLTWLYTMSIHGGKFRAFVKELMEQGKKIPPGIEPYTCTEIRQYK